MKNDIRIDTSFPGHRKTRKLRRMLGGAGVDALLSLWCYTGACKTDGRLTNMTQDDIADASYWADDPQKFIDVLLEVGFLKRLPNGTFYIHDWEEHQPYVFHAKERSEAAKKAAKARWEKRFGKGKTVEESVASDAGRMRVAYAHAEGMQGACGMHAKRIRNAMRNACGAHKRSIAGGMYVACEVQCPFFAERNAPYPTPSPYPIPIYISSSLLEDVNFLDGIEGRKHPKNKKSKLTIDYELAIKDVRDGFGGLTPVIDSFIAMVASLNKSKTIMQSRHLSLLQELWDILSGTDLRVFKESLLFVINKGIDNTNYLKEVIKGKKGESGNGHKSSNKIDAPPGKYDGVGVVLGTGKR